MKRTFRSVRGHLAFAVAIMAAGFSVFACGDDDAVGPGPNADGGNGEGSSDEDGGGTGIRATKLSRASRGSGLDISEDDTILVAANRDVGTISVFDVVGPTLTKKAEISVCAEPWQVALTPNGDRVFVVCRKDQKVVRVDGLRSAPVKGPEVAVGSEPTAIALTPKATHAWVSNWMDGTVTEIDAETLAISSMVDLNPTLVATGTLGGVTARPALAHPRSIAITNNRDDVENDEAIFATEYFSQTKEPLAVDGKNADIARQGFVYKISLKDKSVRTIVLPAIADIGIQDHAGGQVGCHPNQVQAIDVQGSFAYVLSICASPKGPIADFTPAPNTCVTNAECGVNGGFCKPDNTCAVNNWDAKAFQTPAIHVIDIGANKVIAQVALNGDFDELFTAAGLPDTSARRFPLDIDDIAFVPNTLVGYVSAKGSDAVYRVAFNATYETKAVDELGSPGKPFIPLDVGTFPAAKQGKLPIAIAIAHKAKPDAPERFGYVLNEATRNVTTIDLAKDEVVGAADAPAVVASAEMPTTPADEEILEGKRLFGTGLGRWSLNGQAWGSCETCHWEGLSDQETWFHLRGPRQSPSLDQTFDKKTGKGRFQNWSAVVDEIEDHEGGALRGILGGTGAIVTTQDLVPSARINLGATPNNAAGLNGSAAAAANPQTPSTDVPGGVSSAIDDWKKVKSYIKSIRSPRRPSNLDAAAVTAGRGVFEQAKCQGCHGGDNWTMSEVFYTPTAAGTVTAALKTRSWTTELDGKNFPALLLPVTDPAHQTMRWADDASRGANDSMVCLLRNVGTYNVSEPGVGVAEVRRDHTSAAQGDNEALGRGYNTPSLFGIAINAPYLHAGNARTLEALLSDTFKDHHGALSPGFLGAGDAEAATKRTQLIQFLLSIDVDTASIALPPVGPSGGNFCSAP